jgi:crotonobetainyl-CoA:carnitine CoA-transferase CaiB-like acyl-CoA transferase
MTGSLSGIRVTDLTVSVAGPFATQILGDLGADVIKVERPRTGDDTRSWGPPFWNDEATTFLALNRNKRSLAIDLKAPEGQRAFERLVARSDIVVQNLRPGALAKLGFSYERLRGINPRVIFCDMSGYGPAGPMKDLPAYDPLMQAFSGLMSITGEEDRPPVRVPASILDQGTALWTVIAALSALRTRDVTGCGAHVQTSLLQTALMWLPFQLTGYLATGNLPRRLGSGTTGIAPYQAFPTSDGYLIVAAGNDNLWQRLCAAAERRDLVADRRFRDNPGRVRHRDQLSAELSATFQARTAAEWQKILGAAGVPTTPIQTLDEVIDHPQVQALEAIARVEHPRIPDFRVVNLPVLEDGRYPATRRVPPLLGEHTRQVLAELGYEAAEITALAESGVAEVRSPTAGGQTW